MLIPWFKKKLPLQSSWYVCNFAFATLLLITTLSRRPKMCLSKAMQKDASPPCSKFKQWTSDQDDDDDREEYQSILPGLPDDIAMYCLALVPRCNFPAIGGVCKKWRSSIQSKEFMAVRKEAGMVEEWLFFWTSGGKGGGRHWEVVGGGDKWILPPMPGPERVGFAVVVLDGKLLVIAGLVVDGCQECVSADVYQYDSRLNSWSKLADMNVARYDFACAKLDGHVYAIGGYGSNGNDLSSAEVYDPHTNKWSLIEGLKHPRCSCFAYGIHGKLYVMGGRSSFTIGNSRFVDIYDPEKHAWKTAKNGCVMIVTHAMLGERLFCIEWKDQRKLAMFSSTDNSWAKVPVPVTGSSSAEFCLGTMGNKLLLFPVKRQTGFQTLEYDPDAPTNLKWKTSMLQPSGDCLWSVTIGA